MPSRKTSIVLGTTAAALAVAAAVAVTLIVTDSRAGDAASTQPVVVTATSTASSPSTPTTTQTTTVVVPAETTEPTGSLVVRGGECLTSEVRMFGTSASGESLVCGYSGGAAPHWSGHAPLDGSVHKVGDPCDSSVDQVSRDPSGLFIMCGGSTWVTHP